MLLYKDKMKALRDELQRMNTLHQATKDEVQKYIYF